MAAANAEENVSKKLRRDVFVKRDSSRAELDCDTHQIQRKTFPSNSLLSLCSRWLAVGERGAADRIRRCYQGRGTRLRKYFLPSESFRFTHQVKGKEAVYEKIVSRKCAGPPFTGFVLRSI